MILLFLCAPCVQAARTLLILGDSLSAGYGISREAAWPTLLEKRLQEKRFDYNVVNLSISGETTLGGRNRIDAALARYRPQTVIIALGSNDGLRGLPVAAIHENLHAMIASAQKNRARVLLVEQRLPPNYGDYARQFQAVFAQLAREKKVARSDFLLESIATDRRFFQPDGLHPTAEAQPRLLETVWRALVPLLK